MKEQKERNEQATEIIRKIREEDYTITTEEYRETIKTLNENIREVAKKASVDLSAAKMILKSSVEDQFTKDAIKNIQDSQNYFKTLM